MVEQCCKYLFVLFIMHLLCMFLPWHMPVVCDMVRQHGQMHNTG